MVEDLRKILEDDIQALREEIKELKQEVVELKVEVAELRTEIKTIKQNNTTTSLLIKYVVTPLIMILAGLVGLKITLPGL